MAGASSTIALQCPTPSRITRALRAGDRGHAVTAPGAWTARAVRRGKTDIESRQDMDTGAQTRAAQRALDQLVGGLFDAVSFEPGRAPHYPRLHDLFVERGLVIRQGGGESEVFALGEFIASRQARFAEGAISSYRVAELSETTELFGGIAHRASAFVRTGVKEGRPFEVRGMIFIQFVHLADGWKISAAAWADQQAGQDLSGHPLPTEFG
jgi:hypothetical protein